MLHEAKTLARGGKMCQSDWLQVSQQTRSFVED